MNLAIFTMITGEDWKRGLAAARERRAQRRIAMAGAIAKLRAPGMTIFVAGAANASTLRPISTPIRPLILDEIEGGNR